MKRRDRKSGLRPLSLWLAAGLVAATFPALAEPVTQPAIFPAPV